MLLVKTYLEIFMPANFAYQLPGEAILEMCEETFGTLLPQQPAVA